MNEFSEVDRLVRLKLFFWAISLFLSLPIEQYHPDFQVN